MNRWQKVVRFFYDRAMRKHNCDESAPRQLTNLTGAVHIGLMYVSTSPEDDTLIRTFAAQLRNADKQVDILGYTEDPNSTGKDGVLLLHKKGLTWYRVPADKNALAFAAQPFDLLVTCLTAECLPLEYLSAISIAKWRIGPYHPGKTVCFDMMLNIGDGKELSYFLDQATGWLNQIHYDTIKT